MSRRSGRRVSDVTSGIILAGEFTGLPAGGLAGGAGAGTAFEAATGFRFTRASGATVQTGTSTLVSGLGNDAGKIGRANTAHSLALSFEETRTNQARYNKLFLAGGPTKTGGPTDQPAVTTGPDGSPADGAIWTASILQQYYYVTGINHNGYLGSLWTKAVTGTCGMAFFPAVSGAVGSFAVTPTNVWTKSVGTVVSSGGQTGSYIIRHPDTEDGCAQAFAWMQVELGTFDTDAIEVTSAAVTRAGERLFLAAGASAVSNGRLTTAIRLRPKGTGAQYTANMVLWYVDGSNYVAVSNVGRTIDVVIGGVTWTSSAMASWAEGDILDIFVAAGGGAENSRAGYRVNNGSYVDLGASGSPQAAISIAGTLDLLCSGTSNQFTAYVEKIEFYQFDRKPSWVQ